MPLILDNIIVFLFRTFRQAFLAFRCRNWNIVDAVIRTTKAGNGMYPYVEITYVYKLTGVRYSGTCVYGFWYRSSAKEFAGIFAGGKSIKVRYSAEIPARSYFLEADQEF